MTSFSWNVANLERHTADGLVFTVHYTIDANDGTYSSGAYGSIGLEPPTGTPIPYAELSLEIVVEWVKDSLGADKVAEIEAALQAQLDEQHQPSRASGVPWQ
jgi:hypothetical protein